jgi:hypothetical protein
MPIAALASSSQDYSERTLQEVIILQKETHAASKKLRLNITLIVAKRLAQEISLEEYREDHLAAIGLQAALHQRYQGLGVEIHQRRQAEKRSADPSLGWD